MSEQQRQQAAGAEADKAADKKLTVTFRMEGPKGKMVTIPVEYDNIEGEDAGAVAAMAAQVGAAIEGFTGTAGASDKKYSVSLVWKGNGPNKDHDGSARKTGLKYSQALVLEAFALDGLRRLLDMGHMDVGQGTRT